MLLPGPMPTSPAPGGQARGGRWCAAWAGFTVHSAQLAAGSRLWRRLWGWRPGRAEPVGAQALGGPRQGWGGGCVSFPWPSWFLRLWGPGVLGLRGRVVRSRGSFVSAGLCLGPLAWRAARVLLAWTPCALPGGSWALYPAPPGCCRSPAWRQAPRPHLTPRLWARCSQASPTGAPSCPIISDAVTCRGTPSPADVHKAGGGGAPLPRPLPLLSGGSFDPRPRCCVAQSTLGEGVQLPPTLGTGAATAGPEPQKHGLGACSLQGAGSTTGPAPRAG